MAILDLADLSWEDLDRLDRSQTIVFVPVSPLEEHGPHLPVGTDFMAARDVAARAAAVLEQSTPSLNCLMHPGIPIGCAQITADFPGTLSVSGKAVMKVVQDSCAALARHGFKLIVISNHHYEPAHVKAIQVAIARTARRYGVTAADPLALAAYESNRNSLANGLDLSRENHADFEETSFIMYRHPELLRARYRELPPVYVNLALRYVFGAHTLRKMGAVMGYVGSPAEASSEYGRQYLEKCAGLLAEAARRLYRHERLPGMSLQLKTILALTPLT